jgi:NAD(P)-dependent dehydrogenase (short-subunit alcohol dehydrogenase family)
MDLGVEDKVATINISARANFGTPGRANDAAAKAGLIGMAKALCIEAARCCMCRVAALAEIVTLSCCACRCRA